MNSILSETYFCTTPTLFTIQKWTSAKMMRQLVIDQSANRRVVPIQLVTSGLHEGPQSPTIARWMRIDLNPKNPVVFN